MSASQQIIPPVDPDKLEAVRKRYAEEADKRLRPDGLKQFVQLTETDEERLRALVEDPWVDHEALNAKESPIKDGAVYRFFSLGAGFGGLQFAIRLIRDGTATPDDIRLADAAGGFGGTWYWNRFPGLHCDIESSIYLPLLEETGFVPRFRYSPGEDVRLHAERLADQWQLRDKALFRSDVKNVVWDDIEQLWTIRLVEQRGPGAAPIPRQFRAQYVYLAAGVLTRPQIPDIPGLLSFSGDIWHTARWNYKLSGGSQADQTLTGLKGKKVAVVGTAATAIGVIPEVAKYAGELYVVQRTPAYVKPRGQRSIDPKEWRAQVATKKGWQYDRQINWNRFITNSASSGEANLVNDGWTDMPAYSANLGSSKYGIVDPSPDNLAKIATQFHTVDLPHMEGIRDRVDQLVKDPDTAAKLKPWYPSWCKRPTFSDKYLQLFNESHVHLLDTDGKGPSRATEKGLVIGDKEYLFDIIIFGTGYRSPGLGLGNPATRTGIDVFGRHGQSLTQKWQGEGPATLHGYATNGFPNLFFSGTSQATQTGNNTFMLGLIAEHIAHIIGKAEQRVGSGRRAIVEVTKDAEQSHTAEVEKRAPYYAVRSGCTPGYFNAYGEARNITDPKEKAKQAKSVVWAEGTGSFLDYIQKWRDEGSLKGLTVEALPTVRVRESKI